MVLDNLSLKIEENKIIGLIGRNGVGKTTLLKLISGFLQKTAGELTVFGEDPFDSLLVSANMIAIDDQMSFPTSLNLEETLAVAGSFYAGWDEQLAQRLFQYFAFHPHDYYANLSKGRRSTFNMIVGLAARAPLTIFDEPTTGMDAAVRKDFYRALLKDYLASPRTIIISSHHLDEIEDLLEEVILLKDGQVLLHVPIAELKEWAIGLSGKKDVITEWTRGSEILYQQHIGAESSYVVVKNEFSAAKKQEARRAGVEFSPISCSDLCVYLTERSRGGIDDVFNKT